MDDDWRTVTAAFLHELYEEIAALRRQRDELEAELATLVELLLDDVGRRI